MNVGITCACLPSLKTIAKHHYLGSFNDDPVFSTGDPQILQQSSVQRPSSFQTQDSAQSGTNNSVHLTTVSTNASMSIDYHSKEVISSTSIKVLSVQPPEKVMAPGSNWSKDAPQIVHLQFGRIVIGVQGGIYRY